jgi:hypothetical protein
MSTHFNQDVTAAQIFHTLDSKAREIRLVVLLPAADFSARVQCRFKTVSLVSLPEFEAISWCWGDRTETEMIDLEGRAWALRTHLASALRLIRHADHERIIWADALSINQASSDEAKAEKAEQIQLMKYIFSTSEQTVIWLRVPYEGMKRFLSSAFQAPSRGLERVLKEDPVESTGQMTNFLLLTCKSSLYLSLTLYVVNPATGWRRCWVSCLQYSG